MTTVGTILARRTSLAVRTVLEQEALIPGVISVVPADRDVEITDHQVLLQPAAHRSTPSVNRLFRSAAHAHGERLIGVILTGAGSDGASGAHDIKAAGGLVIIENPATAANASMPQSLAPCSVDLVVDFPEIGPLLGTLVAGGPTPDPAEAEATLPVVLAHLRDHSGIDFTQYKSPTSLRRLQRRLTATRQDSGRPTKLLLETSSDAAVNVLQRPDQFLIQVALPGVKSEAIDITSEQSTVTIKAHRQAPFSEQVPSSHNGTEQAGFLVAEFGAGDFTRTITLPRTFRSEQLTASCELGVLTIVVPIAPEAQPKKISVTSSSTNAQQVVGAHSNN